MADSCARSTVLRGVGSRPSRVARVGSTAENSPARLAAKMPSNWSAAPPGTPPAVSRARNWSSGTVVLVMVRPVTLVAAGLQPPAIYRLFGDKDGLLDAVAEHGFATFLAAKHVDPDPPDPVEDLRAGWDLAVEFGLANPALYTLMYSEPTRATSAAFKAGTEILMGRLRRLAAGGWLRVDEELAAMIVRATAHGAVLTWLSLPEDRRDPALLAILRESMVTAVTSQQPAVQQPGPAGAARALRRAARADEPQRRGAAPARGVAGPPRRRRMSYGLLSCPDDPGGGPYLAWRR